MANRRVTGDKTDCWRESYGRVRKDLLRDPESTNRARLRLLGVNALPRDTRLLDVGAGDGNLFRTLRDEGFSQVWGFEYQPELALLHPDRSRIIVASATDIPHATGLMSAVIVMDVLHHLTQEGLPRCIKEIRRVLKSGGVLFVCEPACTLFRKALTVLLMSPLSNISRFSRDKRDMVEQERQTLEPWLQNEHNVPAQIVPHGFRMEFYKRFWLHSYGRFRAV